MADTSVKFTKEDLNRFSLRFENILNHSQCREILHEYLREINHPVLLGRFEAYQDGLFSRDDLLELLKPHMEFFISYLQDNYM